VWKGLTSVVEAGAVLAERGIRGALVNVHTVVPVTREPRVADTPDSTRTGLVGPGKGEQDIWEF
jgi:transketolase C-terminal domain/subunit